MRVLITTLFLTAVSLNTSAQVGALYDAEIRDHSTITDPAKGLDYEDMGSEGRHWIAFSMPVLAGSVSPCCWAGKWGSNGEAGCSLKPAHQSYGTHSGSPETDTVIVYSEIVDGSIDSMQVVGPQCPVDGHGAQVTWLSAVDNRAGMDWLETIARQDDNGSTEHSALHALSMHRDKDADMRLYTLAKETDDELSELAIFWLGEGRGKQGFEMLRKLLKELPNGDTRRHINFALAQNGSKQSTDLLFQIARTDRDQEQRGDALFWLAEGYPERAEKLLLEVIKTEQDEDILEKAVFAISQLPGLQGDELLLKLARDENMSRTVRRQALFWLANSDNDETLVMLAELLTN